MIYSLRQPKFHIIFSQLLFKTKTSFYSPEMMIADSRQRARRQVAMFLLALNMREVLFEQFHRISDFFWFFEQFNQSYVLILTGLWLLHLEPWIWYCHFGASLNSRGKSYVFYSVGMHNHFGCCEIVISSFKQIVSLFFRMTISSRDVFGDCGLIGDYRWGGSYGVDSDFIARENCSVIWADLDEIQVDIQWFQSCCYNAV